MSEQIYEQVLKITQNILGEQGQHFVYGKSNLYGFLFYHYTCSTYSGPYPCVSLVKRDKNVSLYIMGGEPIYAKYIKIFGKSNIGKSCLKIKKLDDKKIVALQEIFEEIKKNLIVVYTMTK